MKTRSFCSLVAQRTGFSQDLVFAIFTACISTGKELMAQGDEWRLPGLGKFFCEDLPERRQTKEGPRRDLDDWEAAPHPKKKIKFDFVPFRPTLTATEGEEVE